MNSYLDSLCTINNSSQNYDTVLGLLDRFENVNEGLSASIYKHFVGQIIPYMSNPEYVIEALGRYDNISDEHRESIIEKANNMIIADRVLNNYKAINKIFKINQTKITDPNRFTESICEKVDTYDVPSYQRMNICIEEACYILEKNHIEYNKNSVVDTVGRYFMTIEAVIDEKDIIGYRKVLKENAFLEDQQYCPYIFSDESEEEFNTIDQCVSYLLSMPEKTLDKLMEVIGYACENCTIEDLCHNFNKLIQIIWDFFKFDTIEITDEDFHDIICHDTYMASV